MKDDSVLGHDNVLGGDGDGLAQERLEGRRVERDCGGLSGRDLLFHIFEVNFDLDLLHGSFGWRTLHQLLDEDGSLLHQDSVLPVSLVFLSLLKSLVDVHDLFQLETDSRVNLGLGSRTHDGQDGLEVLRFD